MKKTSQTLFWIFLLAGVVHFSATAATPSKPKGKSRPAAVVRVDAVTDIAINETVSVVGRLISKKAGILASNVNGSVTRINVEVGDRVQKGQVVAVLDQARLKNTRDLARARLVHAKATRTTREEELALARQERKRLEKLRPTAATSEARYETALRKEAIEEARLDQSKATLQIAKSELNLTELNLGYASIKAPYNGIVTERMIEIGGYVQTGQSVLRLVSDEAVEIEAEVPSTRLEGLIKGIKVSVRMDDGTRHSAIVRAVLPQENLLTRTRVVRFVPIFGSTTTPLATGQSISLEIPSGINKPRLSVHKDAITKKGEASIAYVVIDGAVQLRQVKLGRPLGNRFEVIEGLTKGDLAVVRGNERLRPNDKVRIAKKQ